MGPEASRQTTGQMGRARRCGYRPPAPLRPHPQEVTRRAQRKPVPMPRLALALVFVLALLLCASADAGKAPPSFDLAAVGDMAMAPSSDPGAFFDAAVRHRLAADVTLGNLEGTLATGGSSKCGAGSENCFAFRAPPSYARVLRKAGFTIVNVANNHALDYGETGQAETLAAVKSAGLRHTGRPGEIAYLEQGGVRIALIGVAPYDWAQDLRDIDGAVSARAQGGPEGGRRDRDDARRRGRAGRAARPRGDGDVPRREPRQPRGVRPRSDPRGRRRRDRARSARPPRARVVRGATDRLQPRQLPRQRHALDGRRLRRQRDPPPDTAPRTARSSAARSCPCS